jgi:hypothetical protein
LLQFLLLSLGLASFVQVQSKDSHDDDDRDRDDRNRHCHGGFAAANNQSSATLIAYSHETHLEDEPVSAFDSAPRISPEEVEAGGRFGVPVVLGCSTPSVAVAELVVPVSVYCPSVRLMLDDSVADSVVEVTVVETGGLELELESDHDEDEDEDSAEVDSVGDADSDEEVSAADEEVAVEDAELEDDAPAVILRGQLSAERESRRLLTILL